MIAFLAPGALLTEKLAEVRSVLGSQRPLLKK